MRKQSPMSTNIPTNPRTISGQWMTFSHMANHYRKLVNVKPRVDSGLSRSGSGSMTSLHQSPKRTRSNLNLHRAGFYSSTETMMTENRNCCPVPVSPAKRHKLNIENSRRSYSAAPKCSVVERKDSFDGDGDSLCSENCQMVYGPVRMKRSESEDALPSDIGANLEQILSEPQLKTISIGEKIRRFLNHIHSQEKIATKPKLIKRSSNPSVPAPSRPLPVRSQRSDQRVEESPVSTTAPAGDRHSCCFTSYTVSRRTSRLSEDMTPVKRTSKVGLKGSSSTPSCRPVSAKSPGRSSLRSAPPAISSQPEEDYVAFQGLLAAFGNRRTPSITKPLSQRASLINPSNVRKFTKPSFGSPQSIGTIHCSEDLAEEADEELEQDLIHNPSTSRQFREDRHTSGCINNNSSLTTAAPWVQDKIAKTNTLNNECFSPRTSNQQSSPSASSSNTSVPKSSKSSSSRAPSGSHIPNKDSSRDSAYGFSSGESRITTRESTPEKRSRNRSQSSSEPPRSRSSSVTVVKHSNAKYKSTLSTVASSVNQEDHNSSISQLESLSDSGDSLSRKSYLGATTKKNVVNMSPQRSKCISAKTSSDKIEDSRYVQFLTAVTDDIVTRGVYTNKGIKNVFKFHMANHADLNVDKMMSLLERLRMDMGVPKEDSLDRLDFGYGSVKYSSGPYFRKGSLETPPSPNSPSSSSSSGNELQIAKPSSKKGKSSSRSSRKPSVISMTDHEKAGVEENQNFKEVESLFEHEAEFEDHNHFLIDTFE